MGNLNLSSIAQGQQSMYQTSNDADNQLDLAMTDLLEVDLSGGAGATVSPAQMVRACCFQTFGNTTVQTLTFPAVRRQFVVDNNGTAAVTVAIGTTTFSVPASATSFFYSDGTANGLNEQIVGGAGAVASVGGLTGAITLTALLDAIGSAAEGDILYRNATVWARLPAGTAGLFLQTGGTGAIPAWASPLAAPRVQTVTFASTVTLDCSAHDVFEITLTGAITVNFTGGTDGQRVQVKLIQDGTGSRVVTWGTGVAFGTDLTSAVASTAANKIDYFALCYDGINSKYDMLAAARGF